MHGREAILPLESVLSPQCKCYADDPDTITAENLPKAAIQVKQCIQQAWLKNNHYYSQRAKDQKFLCQRCCVLVQSISFP